MDINQDNRINVSIAQQRPALSKLNIASTFFSTSTSTLLFTSTLIFILFLTGCAGTQEVKRRYLWPPLPDTPVIEWVGTYSSQLDFPKSGTEAFLESVVGSEPDYLRKPWGVASDGNGKMYVTDPQNADVKVFDMNKKTMTPFLEEEEALFKVPIGVALDASGNIYISDSNKHRIFVFSSDKKPLFNIGEDGKLNGPTGLAVDDERKRLYIVNSRNNNIAVYDLKGNFLFTFSGPGTWPGRMNYPTDLDIDSKGNIVVADAMNARVQIFGPDGKFINRFGQRGDGLTDFQLIKGIAVDKKTDNIYVVDGRGDRFIIFSKSGEPLLAVGRTASASKRQSPGGFSIPQDISIDKNGAVYVVDSINGRVQVFQIIDEEWLRKNPLK
ncbi:MAG: 6-bladed beta-propeller [Deltaproteobacteria bacterium]|nr:6-bladed beta-propeller [Deltaproteobacteria bacterium]